MLNVITAPRTPSPFYTSAPSAADRGEFRGETWITMPSMTHDAKSSNLVALVPGASRGIGRVIATQLAERCIDTSLRSSEAVSSHPSSWSTRPICLCIAHPNRMRQSINLTHSP
jgi:hypothetical protein